MMRLGSLLFWRLRPRWKCSKLAAGVIAPNGGSALSDSNDIASQVHIDGVLMRMIFQRQMKIPQKSVV